VKFAIYKMTEEMQKELYGSIDGIGSDHASLKLSEKAGTKISEQKSGVREFNQAAELLLDILQHWTEPDEIRAIGHRIVFGMDQPGPAIINDALLNDLKERRSFDPDHLPAAIEFIERLGAKLPGRPQVACFDTSFHSTIPEVAKMFPLPAALAKEGIRRYGYHGLSYTYLMEVLKKETGDATAGGRIILAHLGSGASLAAVKEGRCVDTSMGFTPAGGIMMGTRCGDIDPGIAWHLMENKKMNADRFNQLINHESGLLGVSGLSADMKELLENEQENVDAARAVALFCYIARKWIGAFTAVLGGLDTLVFTGGIGENAPLIRQRICDGLKFLELEMDEEKNNTGQWLISSPKSAIQVFVIRTDEERVIAEHVKQICGKNRKHAIT
jgi:acetate kinase